MISALLRLILRLFDYTYRHFLRHCSCTRSHKLLLPNFALLECVASKSTAISPSDTSYLTPPSDEDELEDVYDDGEDERLSPDEAEDICYDAFYLRR